MDVVDAIENQPTTVKNPHRDVPVTPVVILKAEILNTPETKAAPDAGKIKEETQN
jgi:hypothetical protein